MRYKIKQASCKLGIVRLGSRVKIKAPNRQWGVDRPKDDIFTIKGMWINGKIVSIGFRDECLENWGDCYSGRGDILNEIIGEILPTNWKERFMRDKK